MVTIKWAGNKIIGKVKETWDIMIENRGYNVVFFIDCFPKQCVFKYDFITFIINF